MTAQIIDFEKKTHDPLCSFCNTPKSKAKAMIQNQRESKNICDKCIKHAMIRIQEESK